MIEYIERIVKEHERLTLVKATVKRAQHWPEDISIDYTLETGVVNEAIQIPGLTLIGWEFLGKVIAGYYFKENEKGIHRRHFNFDLTIYPQYGDGVDIKYYTFFSTKNGDGAASIKDLMTIAKQANYYAVMPMEAVKKQEALNREAKAWAGVSANLATLEKAIEAKKKA
jgi:hypothetical protein